MKINFFAKTNNTNTASYRIWVHDLNILFNKNKIKSKIVYDINEIDEDCEVIILCKSAYRNNASFVKKKYPQKLLGAINVDCDYHNKDIDFVIVGSIEEYASLSFYENVFIVDLIEEKFKNIARKIHTEKDELVIGYHGNYPHLFKFFPFLQQAIEEISLQTSIRLKIITGDSNFKWQIGKPNIENIDMYNYKDINVSEVIKTFDIGVVPNVTDLRVFQEFSPIAQTKNLDIGINTTDYFLRFKNKTNPGRAYVLYQHGIPVIHDLSPSSFALMHAAGIYSCAHSKESWVKEIKRMKCHKTRELFSKKYFELFNSTFSNEKRVKDLIDNIGSLICKK